MTTETQAPTAEERLSGIEDSMKSLNDQLKALNAPGATGVAYDSNGRVTSYFEDDGDEVEIEVTKSRMAQEARPVFEGGYRRRVRKSLKEIGYVPHTKFKSLGDLCRQGYATGGLGDFKTNLHDHFKAVQGLSEGIGTDGGFLVPPEFSMNIFEHVYSNDIWSKLDHYTVAGNNMTFLASSEVSRAHGSRAGGLSSDWLGEGDTITASKPGLRPVSLKLKKLAVVVYLTDELIEDAGVALEQRISRQVADEFNFRLGDAVFNGNGGSMPLGVHNAPSFLGISRESGQTKTVIYENIEKMWSRALIPSRARGTWYFNQDVEPQLQFSYLDSGNGMVPTYQPPGGMSAASYGTLKGRPAMATEFNPTLGTVGDIGLYDLSQVVAINKGGIAQASSMHVQFLTAQQALRFIIRVDAQPWENSPITPFQGTATQSSFVGLETRPSS